MTDKSEINEYLCCEFGFEDSTSKVTDEWPFKLSEVGNFTTPEGESKVFLFNDGDEEYFAVAGRSLTYFPKAGMEISHLRLQSYGASWIAARDPVDLNTSILADKSVPSSTDRRKEIEVLAKQRLNDTAFTILEGLFLRSTGDYLALVQPVDSDKATIVGTKILMRKIPFPFASAWRRLAVGVGNLIETGKIG